MTPEKSRALYRFSPIKSEAELRAAVEYVHFACHQLCERSFASHLSNAGNIGIFCHYDDEYAFLTKLRIALTEPSTNPDQKYFKLHTPIIISAKNGVPATTYTHLYIRKPDPYRAQVGDVDFFLEPALYEALKTALLRGTPVYGARIFDRKDLDMIELYDPDIDALAYVSTERMTQDVRVKITANTTP